MMKYVISIMLLLVITCTYGNCRADDSQMMTVEQLRSIMERPDVLVIDVRTAYDWDSSKIKIKRAVREEGMKFGSWMDKYPKDKTIVIYCA
jgi:rhodanese-related sulfurtransferase